MCVRCGTGRIARCESPDRHGGYPPSVPPLTTMPGAITEAGDAAELTPLQALLILERQLGFEVLEVKTVEDALTRLWDLVLKGK
jgi:hypothetical protein